MTTDFRALCAELLQECEYLHDDFPRDKELWDRARAALSAPPATAALIDALVKAECALADIAEGEGDAVPWWAENRCSDTLAIIRPVMQQHGIRTSEWPPASQPARAAPAQPVPEGPTDDDVDALVICIQGLPVPDADDLALPSIGRGRDMVRRALARWGRPAVEPVPVAERPPEPEDCDAKGRCWFFHTSILGGHEWFLILRPKVSAWYRWQSVTHWLPHWALPVPQEGE